MQIVVPFSDMLRVLHILAYLSLSPFLACLATTDLQCGQDVIRGCQVESKQFTNDCFDSCHPYLHDIGGDTSSYQSCFTRNEETVVEAEVCTFKTIDAKYGTEWITEESGGNEYTHFNFTSRPHYTIRSNSALKLVHAKYRVVQNYLHCTKHCLHKKINECTHAKGCPFNWPSADILKKIMLQCTQSNIKIAMSLLRACNCMYIEKKASSLLGMCGVFGLPLFIDNA